MFRSKHLLLVVSLLAVLSMVISACAPAATPTAAPAAPKATDAPKPAEPTKAPEVKPTDAPKPTDVPAPAEKPWPTAKDAETYLLLQSGVDPDTLDPHINYETQGGGMLFNVYEGLVTFDGKNPVAFKAQLAESIPDPKPLDNGGVEYTWQIKKGVKFHEGQEMTAEIGRAHV